MNHFLQKHHRTQLNWQIEKIWQQKTLSLIWKNNNYSITMEWQQVHNDICFRAIMKFRKCQMLFQHISNLLLSECNASVYVDIFVYLMHATNSDNFIVNFQLKINFSHFKYINNAKRTCFSMFDDTRLFPRYFMGKIIQHAERSYALSTHLSFAPSFAFLYIAEVAKNVHFPANCIRIGYVKLIFNIIISSFSFSLLTFC